MQLKNIKTLLIDGDGVLWRHSSPIPGFQDFFDALDEKNIRWALVTNNNTQTVNHYLERLREFGANPSRELVINSTAVTIEYVIERYGEGAPIYVVGMAPLLEMLTEAGFEIFTGEEPPAHEVKAVVAGMDRQLTYEKVTVATRLILSGAEFIATNTDPGFPTPEGLAPGTGMVIGALQGTTRITPTIMGKPGTTLYKTAMQRLNADPATTAMIGDRLETDILGAERVGIWKIAVLSGITSYEEIATSPIQPDLVFESIAEIAEALRAV